MSGNKYLSVLFTVISAFVAMTAAIGQENIQLIAGFERDELKNWDDLSDCLTFKEISSDTLQLHRQYVIIYYFTNTKITQGEFALFDEIDEAEFKFRQSMFDSTREPDETYGDREWYIERHGYLFRQYQWFRDVFNKDWSQWDEMWIDVLSTNADAVIRVRVEDHWEASGNRNYEIPAGQFVTIKFELKKVATVGGIDLSDMNCFWIGLYDEKGPTTVFVDNIRLAKSDALKNDGIPFVTDDSTIQKRVIPEVYVEPIVRPDIKKNNSAVADSIIPILINILKPSGHPFLGGGPYGSHERAISAYDNDHLMVIITGQHKDFGIHAIGSHDGGKTWTGIDGTNDPTFVCNGRAIRHHSIFEDSNLGDGYLVTLRSCTYVGGLANVLFYKFIFMEDKWLISPEIISYDYLRHCPESIAFTKLPDGTFWSAFDNWDTVQGVDIHAVRSIHDGEKWEKIAKSPKVNNSANYSRTNILLTPYQDGVACLFQKSYDRWGWAYCDNETWIDKGLIEINSNSFKLTSVVTINGNQMFAVLDISGKLNVTRSVENGWHKDMLDDGTNGRVLRSILTSVKEIPFCIWAREISTDNYGLFFRRFNTNQGVWESTHQILSGEKDEIYNLAAPVESPPNYIPLLFDSAPIDNVNSDEYWLKFIKIPVDTNLAPGITKLAFPLNGSSHQDSTITLKWHAAADAKTYHLQMNTIETFSRPLYDFYGLTDTTLLVTYLDPKTTYYWRVMATNEAGDAPWSEVWSFNVTVVPVELANFSVNFVKNCVELKWTTVSETNNYGFEIQRGENKSDVMTIGFVKGFGTSTELHDYVFIDNDVNDGAYYYRLKQNDFDGSFEYSDFLEISINMPEEFVLEQNYPNPFNSVTMIKFHIPGNENVPTTLNIFDINGRKVKDLIDSEQNPGIHYVYWHAKDNRGIDVSNGVYFVILKSGKFTSAKKIIYLK